MKSNNPRQRGWTRAGAVLLLVGAAQLTGACTTPGAKPWDRDLLARNTMSLNAHPLITACNEHIYFSKEGSSGGRSFDGGGCGCN